jgi:two-component system, OmpR family, sensor kinase
MKLRNRLLIGLGGVAVAFGITGFLIANTQQRYLTEQVDRQLQNSIGIAFAFFGNRPIPADRNDPGTFSEVFLGHLDVDGTLIALQQGPLVTGAPKVTLALAQAHTPKFVPGQGGGPGGPGQNSAPFTVDGVGTGDSFRVIVLQRRESTGYEIVALSLAKADSAYIRLLIATGIGAVVVLSVISLTAAWVLRLGVRPINDVTEAADAISAGDRNRRLPRYPDGTEAAHLAAAFNSMLDQKEAADERLRQFVADASHELRTPLTSIRGYVELYHRGGLTEQDRLDDAMRRVSGEAERMGALVDDLLLLSKLDRGLPLDMANVDLVSLLEDAAADARAVQPARTVEVRTDRPLVCTGDPLRLHQVVAAIVANALVYTPADTPIELVGSQRNGAVLVEIVDHGPGMDDETASHVFERFFRGDASRARSTGGSGLGLSIAKSIVEAHDGRLVLQTAPGAGCRFKIALPVSAPANAKGPNPSSD